MFRLALLLLTLCAVPIASASSATTDTHRSRGAAAARLQAFAQVEQPEPGAASPDGAAEAHEEAAGEEAPHEETIWGPIARLFNFLVLAGVLYHFLRKPVADYLGDRSTQIRNDLVTAAALKESATAQIAELERKMATLPHELDLLKARGHEDILAEEARIEQAAAAERERLLEQTRREINRQLRLAHRQLVEHASNLAVGLATERIKKSITPEDQERLVDRYLQQVKG